MRLRKDNKGFIGGLGLLIAEAAAGAILLGVTAGLGLIPDLAGQKVLIQGQKQAAIVKKGGQPEDGWFRVNSKSIGHDIAIRECRQIVGKSGYGKKFLIVRGLKQGKHQAEAESIIRNKTDCEGDKLVLLVRLK